MRFVVVILFILVTFGAYAAKQRSPTVSDTTAIAKIRKDSTTLKIRTFNREALQKYKGKKDFTYNQTAPQSTSLWDRFWIWFWGVVRSIFSGGFRGSIVKYILTGIVIALVVFITIKLIGLDYNIFARKSKQVHVPFEENLENIHEINFDEQIEKAISSSNYRLAVRLLYLKTLKLLSDQQLIEWKADKTNQAYVAELNNNDFTILTTQFEYIWYGEFFIDKLSFENINESFQVFNANRI